YSAEDLSGKWVNKAAVLKEFGLDETRMERPLLAMISRIEEQKGFDLLVAMLDDTLSQHDLSFVLLGMGNKEIENALQAIVARHPGRAGVRLGYNNALAHLIEAGADL